MKLQFEKTVYNCLGTAARELREQELTQEVKLPDGLPDIGSVTGAWGQVVLRSKEWRSTGMQVSGGIMAWVLYDPEDGSDHRSVETWIPFQMKWDFPETDREGTIRVAAVLRSLDARTISARKLMLRAGLEALGEALVPMESAGYLPEEVPEGVELLHRTYPMVLPREAGEKTFLLDETLTLPGSVPPLEKLIRYEVVPELLDRKVMAEKLVFRGTAHLHILYRGPGGQFQSWDFELPFSQFAELDQEHPGEAEADVWMALTSLELDPAEDGLHLKCGLLAQYEIRDPVPVAVVEDAYGIGRTVKPQLQELLLPAVLETHQELLHGEQVLPVSGNRIVDIAFLPGSPRQRWTGEVTELSVSGTFRVLYYDENGALQAAAANWEDAREIPMEENCCLRVAMQNVGRPQAASGGGTMTAKGDVALELRTEVRQGIPMVTELETGEAAAADPGRPSLILRRAGEASLWELAKSCCSTVSAIRQANHLPEDPDPGQLLLIPVCGGQCPLITRA